MYIPNGFSAASGTAQPQHAVTPLHPTVLGAPTPAATPTPVAPPAVFPVNHNITSTTNVSASGIPGFNILVQGAGLYPFGIHGPYPNSQQTSHFNNQATNWNYGLMYLGTTRLLLQIQAKEF